MDHQGKDLVVPCGNGSCLGRGALTSSVFTGFGFSAHDIRRHPRQASERPAQKSG